MISFRKFGIVFIILLILAIILLTGRIIWTNNVIVLDSFTAGLKHLPYLAYVPEAKDFQRTGVVIYNKNLSYAGINIYNPISSGEAYLIDMSGSLLHTWFFNEIQSNWSYAKMDDTGNLLVVLQDKPLMKLDWDSNVLWTNNLQFHHNVVFSENRELYALTRDQRLIHHRFLYIPILDDYITILSDEGELMKRISVFDLFKDDIPSTSLDSILLYTVTKKLRTQRPRNKINFSVTRDTIFDILHTNSIEIINQSIDGLAKKGDVLITIRQLDLVAIVDIENESVAWTWGKGELDMPHHPTMLENGNILIFDNGYHRKYSRIIELDPLSETIVWEYKTDPPKSFFSYWGGANQRLPNGNTLITDTENGRVFEITRQGKIVWEFYTPSTKQNGSRATIFRMERMDLNSSVMNIKET